MLIRHEKSCLLIVDVQEKLMPQIQHSSLVESRCAWLMQLASEINVPLMVSEQYSKGLGETLPSLKKWMPGKTDIDKLYFSCYQDANFLKHWRMLHRKQVILAGIETHVCVLQTALDMNAAGIDVFVVVDAVGSRHPLDHECALQRMTQAGVHLVTSEMVLFEWLKTAEHAKFKLVSQNFLKSERK